MATYSGEKVTLLADTSTVDINATNQSTGHDRGTIITRKMSDTRLATVTYSVLIALMVSLLIGYAMGYSSPVIKDLQLGGSPKKGGEELEHGYRGIFSALLPLGALVGSPLAAWLVELFGRKDTLLLCSVPFTAGWLVLVFSYLPNHVTSIRTLLFVGRFIVGIGVGSASLCVPLYIAELSPPMLRGFYGATHHLVFTVGLFMVEFVGTYVKYYWLAVIPLCVIFLFAVLSVTLRETPRWLISHGHVERAGWVLLWLRGRTYDIVDEQREIEDQVKCEKKLSFFQTLQHLKTRSVCNPLILAVFLMFFQQFSGINAIIFNAEGTFIQTNVSNPGLLSSFAVGLTQIFGTFFGVILTDVVGRRALLIFGAAIMCGGISVAGGYKYLVGIKHVHYDSMIITSIMVYNFGYSVGWGALPWLITSEIIPLRVRGAGVGIVTFANWSFAAFVTGLYYYFQLNIDPWNTFWTFGFVCLCATVFVALFIPETKGRTLEGIERSFRDSSLHNVP